MMTWRGIMQKTINTVDVFQSLIHPDSHDLVWSATLSIKIQVKLSQASLSNDLANPRI